MPITAMTLAVPPDERISQPSSASFFMHFTMPFLLYTESRAVGIAFSVVLVIEVYFFRRFFRPPAAK